MTTIFFIAPTINVTITLPTEPPAFGRSYSLICTVTGADPSLNVEITYHWFRADSEPTSSGMVTRVGTDSSRLHLDFLSLSDVGLYNCMTTVSSNLLSEDIESISETFELKFPGQPLILITVSFKVIDFKIICNIIICVRLRTMNAEYSV